MTKKKLHRPVKVDGGVVLCLCGYKTGPNPLDIEVSWDEFLDHLQEFGETL